MKLHTIAAAVVAVAALGGCATATTGVEIIGAGLRPTLAQAEAAIRDVLNNLLKDPESVKQFSIDSSPTHVSWHRGLVGGGGHESAWLWCVTYNGKTSAGAYAGVKREGVRLRVQGDQAIAVPPRTLSPSGG